MKLADHLRKEQHEKLKRMKTNRHKKQCKERIDWHDLMGQNNRGMRRKKGGAWKNG